ncbi:MAG: hypothetical protein AAFR33_01025 [Pseudomonadota bacterium]
MTLRQFTPLLQAPPVQVGLGIGVVVVGLLVWGLMTWSGTLPGNDDMMRLAQVRDLLAGQNWWDVTQSRFDTPEGGAMHWSRVPDVFIGGLVMLLTPFLGAETAEFAALAIWPRLVLAGTLTAMAVALHRLGAGRAGIVAGLLAFLLSHAVVQFQPGRIDHHGFELMLALTAFAALCSAQRGWRTGVFVAACIALMLTVAIESLPYAAGSIALCGVLWVIRGDRDADLLRGLGGGLAGFAVLAYVLDAPGAGAGRAVCDAYGNFHASALILGGGGLFALGSTGRHFGEWRGRLAAGLGLSMAAGLTALAVDPSCLGSPYSGVDAEIMDGWMVSVTEARDLPRLFATSPAFGIAVFGFALVALIAGGASGVLIKSQNREMVVGLAALTALAVLVMAWQVRAVVFAHGFGAICAGLAAHHLIERLRAEEGTARVAALAGLLVLSPTTWQTAGMQLAPHKTEEPAEQQTEKINCRSAQSLAALSGLPPGRVFAPIDLGAAILVHTDHTIFAAPYHRNPQAIGRAIAVFEAPPQEAKIMLQASGADYLFVCEDLGEFKLYAKRAPEGLAAELANARRLDWLRPAVVVNESPGVQVYRIRQDAVAGTPQP